MGALIRTKGTIRLARFFNEEFGTHIAFYRRPANITWFDITTAKSGTASQWIDLWNVITHLQDPARNIYPLQLPAHPRHPNLPVRWQWFMNTANSANGSLTQQNHDLIAQYIFQGLNNGAYNAIVFDTVEIAPPPNAAQAVPPPQNVTISGANCLLIVLQTAALSPLALPAVGGNPGAPVLDSQFDIFLNSV